jgi:hypothetical protein
MKEATDIKFHGLELDNYMNWKNQIERMLPEISSACYAAR